MTTIHPERLRIESEQVAEQVADLPKLMQALDVLFEAYADRTRRPAATYRAEDAADAYGAPAPVLREVHQAFERALTDQPQAREPLVGALWQASMREPKQIAVWLVGGMPWYRAVAWAEAAWGRLDDPVLERALAKRGLNGWQDLPMDDWLEQPLRWLRGRKPPLRRVALRLLALQANRVDPGALVRYLQALDGALSWRDDARRRLLRRVLEVVIERSPAEAAQFLLDQWAHQPRASVKSMVRSLLPSLPAPQQQVVLAAIWER